MKTKNFKGIVALLLVLVVMCTVFAGCKPAGGTDTTTGAADHTTLMPGYIDDNGTESHSESEGSDSTRPSVQFNPDGPVKGENNNSQQGGSQSNQTQGEDKAEDVAGTEATQSGTKENAPQTKPTETPTADKTEAPVVTKPTEGISEASTAKSVETTQEIATSTAQDATDATETPVQNTTEKSEEKTEAETESTTVPEFTLPELPDSDIIGPKPPVNPDDFIIPEFTTSAMATTADSSDITAETNAELSTVFVPVTTTQAAPVDFSGRLEFTYYGSFSGKFLEDGTDEYVQNVAILLVTNISEEYLEYAVATFDISGQAAAFVATGLAPGESCWVLEKNRLQVDKGAVFTHVDDIASFTKYIDPADTDVQVVLGDGQLSVKNNTGEDLSNVYVYYKQVHTDGNFLGGITYRVPMGNLLSGEEASSVAMHCNVTNCRVVSVTYSEEG
ncbi:MAG: hypothetical protein IJ298_02060 [Ruminococcus sp.]|nr:hypothetical protein [Ruminococcus sp.]